jgi:glycyl-tRNA synthetase beta subunit
MTDELIQKLMQAGLTKAQATSMTAEKCLAAFMPDDCKVVIAEARRQVEEMKAVNKRMFDRLDDVVKTIELSRDSVTDEKAKNIIGLYSALLNISLDKADEYNGFHKDLDINSVIKELSYIMYAYAGGNAERIE